MREAADRCSIHSTPIRSHGLQQDKMKDQYRNSIAHINACHQYICLANCYLTHSLVKYTCKEGGTKQTGNVAYTVRKDMTNQ